MEEVIVIENNLTKEEKKNNLKKLYDVISKIGKQQRERGIDVSRSFMTIDEYNNLKLKKPETFI